MRANVRSYHNGVATLTNKNVSSVVVLNLKPALAASLAITHNNNLKTKPNRCYCCSIRLNERSIVSFRLVSFINETNLNVLHGFYYITPQCNQLNFKTSQCLSFIHRLPFWIY